MTRIFHRSFLWKWILCQVVTSVLCLLFRPKIVHCSTKNAYTSEITFLALVPWRLENDAITSKICMSHSRRYNLSTFFCSKNISLFFYLNIDHFPLRLLCKINYCNSRDNEEHYMIPDQKDICLNFALIKLKSLQCTGVTRAFIFFF